MGGGRGRCEGREKRGKGAEVMGGRGRGGKRRGREKGAKRREEKGRETA